MVCCDLLENSYLCGISNNLRGFAKKVFNVVICLKIRTFVVSATTRFFSNQPIKSCDLLENSYLCGISNNPNASISGVGTVVICLKIRTFVVSATTFVVFPYSKQSCDLLENSYLCGISNNISLFDKKRGSVVICLKIRTFVVSATTLALKYHHQMLL